MLEVVGHEVPEPLAAAAAAQPGESPLFLGDRRTHGGRGERLPRWRVVVNVDPVAVREETRR